MFSGVGGNLVAVQASRISTSLYQAAKIGSLPNGPLFRFISPLRAFFSSGLLTSDFYVGIFNFSITTCLCYFCINIRFALSLNVPTIPTLVKLIAADSLNLHNVTLV